MNRICLFLCFLCIPWVARGQSAYDWVYWFDNDDSHQHSGTVEGNAFTISALADGLDTGLHAFHVQVADTVGKYSPPHTQMFFYSTGSTVKTLRYWFDNDVEHIVSIPMPLGTATIDVSHLEPGIHFVYCQVEDQEGLMSDVVTQCFYRQLNTSATQLSYWFDVETSARETMTYPGEVVMVDVSDLSEGFHTIHSQLTEHAPSDVVSRMFIKIPQTKGVGEITCICTVDEKLIAQHKVPATGGIISWNMDVDSLGVGLHRAMFQAITPSGAASTLAERYFVRVISEKEMSKMKCVYSLDNQQTHAQSGTMSAGGKFHFDLDVTSMEDGLHRLAYTMVSEDGVTTPQKTAFFWKTPLGGAGIVQYDYWLNDDQDNMRSTHLDTRENPYKLISLLPVDTHPIRSSCFHFEVKDGQPRIYAMNDFHLRFYDTASRCLTETKQYIDYQVTQAVTDIIALNSGDCKTVARPEENTIQWFKFYAEEGDTVTFRTDQAATIQVFSPEGKEIYKASGNTSVVYGGCHTWVDGDYYVALHDVTGSKPSISLDFTHLAKYDVVSYDVATVGNGGCSTITFKGNGFRNLYAVDFISAANDSIRAFSIGHESDGTTSVTADFTDVELGKYTALFHFTEGKKYVYDAITVEEAKAIELATEVTFPRSFGHVVTYTCKITNNGNMTAFAVPIYTWLKSKTMNGIYHIEYDGLDLPGLFDGIDTDSLTATEIAELNEYSDAAGDDHHFMKFWAEDEDHQGDSVYVRSNYFFTNIAPYETKTLYLTISTRESDAFAYFTVPEDWFSCSVEQVSNGATRIASRFKRSSMKDKYCCIRDKIECYASVKANTAGMINLLAEFLPNTPHGVLAKAAASIADCKANLQETEISMIGDLMCGKDANDTEKNFWDQVNALREKMSNSGVLWSCIEAAVPELRGAKWLKRLGNGADIADALGLSQLAADCKKAFSTPMPGCPPPPPVGGGAQGGQSHDPNEIYGYLAESGSKFITDEVEKVNYRIEFENDTAFATRSAMVVEIRDTLDSNLFDLSSYAPTGIKIGEKLEYLDGEQNFVRTIDMRPEINGLVEVEGKYDAKKGIMTWLFTSIDPMTMEPTNDPMDGFLPVNTNGQGIGEVSYDIKLKQKMAEGTEISNRASIVFDINEPILTPTWKNTIDATAPESHVTGVKMLNDSTAAVSIEATDELSGPWRYNVYVQYGSGAWFLEAENVPIDTTASVKVYEGINHGFYVVVTDSAGNVEQKEAAREYTFEVFAPQVDTNTKLQLAQGWNWMSHNQQEALSAETLKPKAQRIVSQTDELYKDGRFGWMGTLDELLPTQMYKVQMAEADEVQLSGRLFNAAFRAVPLYAGWNWIGYPVAQTMTPAEALKKMEAEEDDAIIGRDGLATYSDGEWTGTLAEMVPGQGYMYRSASDKALFLNATAQASSRAVNRARSMTDGQWPEDWTVDRQRYPNVMGMVAELWQDGKPVDDSGEWLLGAFSSGECRGLAETVGNHLMMNVYGRGGEKIEFFVMHRESGEILPVSESEEFRADLLGTVRQPYRLNMGVLTGISDAMRLNNNEQINNNWYDLQGRRISVSSASSENSVLPKGVYIVTDGQKKGTQKVVRK